MGGDIAEKQDTTPTQHVFKEIAQSFEIRIYRGSSEQGDRKKAISEAIRGPASE